MRWEPMSENKEDKDIKLIRKLCLNEKYINKYKLERILQGDSDYVIRILNLANIKYKIIGNEILFLKEQYNPPTIVKMAEAARREVLSREGSYQQLLEKEGFIASYHLISQLQEELRKFNEEYPEKNGSRVFIMMRFKDTELFNELEVVLKDSLTKEGYQAILANEKNFTHESVWRNVCVYMLGCETGISVMEKLEDETINPNVLIELGFMLSLGKDCLVLKEETLKDKLPVDIIARIYEPFNGSSKLKIKESVTKAIQSWAKKRV